MTKDFYDTTGIFKPHLNPILRSGLSVFEKATHPFFSSQNKFGTGSLRDGKLKDVWGIISFFRINLSQISWSSRN